MDTSRQPTGHEAEDDRESAARAPSAAPGPSARPAPSAAPGPQRAPLLRRDAERNRQRILAAAAEVFTERGLDASLDDVARHAGVGVGTVYRRFPDKASLADALFDERIDTLAGMAEDAEAEPDAWSALVRFLEQSAEMLTSDRGLRQILMFAAHGHDRAECARDRIRPAIDSLVKRAQADGQVRADIAATDIPIIEFMLAAVAEYAQQVRPALWRRYLPLLLDALRPERGLPTALPEPELSEGEMVQVLNSNPLTPLTPLTRRPAPHKAARVTVRP